MMGTVSKALKILKYFPGGSAEIGLSEISRLTGQNKATAYRYLCELESSSFIEQNSETKRYRLGAAISDLARLSNPDTSILRIFAQILEAVSEEASCWAFLYPGASVPLKPVLVFNKGARHEGMLQEISPYSSPGVCRHAVCRNAPCATEHSNLHGVKWEGAIAKFRAQGVAPSPRPNATTASFSAPIFDVAGIARYIVTLVGPRNLSDQNLVPLKSAALLAARSGTAAIGGFQAIAAAKTKPTRSHIGAASRL